MSQKRKQNNVAFSVIISPGKRQKNEDEEIVAILAPFNPFPKVCIEHVKINETATRDVILRNPTNNEINVELTKLPSSDRGFEWSSTQFTLPRQSESTLTIHWTPTLYGSWRDNVKVVNKKNLKTISELILISSTEEPPKVSKRCLRSQTQSTICRKSVKPCKQPSLSKQTGLTSSKCVTNKNIAENKENIETLESNREQYTEEKLQNRPSIKIRKDLKPAVGQELSLICHETLREQRSMAVPSTITFSKQCTSLPDKQILKTSSVFPPNVTADDSKQKSIAHSTPRRTTYEVLDPVSFRRSTYSLRNKQVTNIIGIEQEKQIFENIASPSGIFNESLEIAASKLVENEASKTVCLATKAKEPALTKTVSLNTRRIITNRNEFSGDTFVISKTVSPDVTQTCENTLRRTTYEIVRPISSSKLSSKLSAISENFMNVEQKLQPRLSLESVGSSDNLYDSLENAEPKLGEENLLAELDDYDFERISLSSQNDKCDTLKSFKTFSDDIDDFNNITCSSRKSVNGLSEDSLSPKVLLVDIKRLSDKFDISLSKTVKLNKTYTPITYKHDGGLSIDHIPLSLSNKTYEFKSSNSSVSEKSKVYEECSSVYPNTTENKTMTVKAIQDLDKQFKLADFDTFASLENSSELDRLSFLQTRPEISKETKQSSAQNFLGTNTIVDRLNENIVNNRTNDFKENIYFQELPSNSLYKQSYDGGKNMAENNNFDFVVKVEKAESTTDTSAFPMESSSLSIDMQPDASSTIKHEPVIWDISPPVKKPLHILPDKKSVFKKSVITIKSSPKVKKVGHIVAKSIVQLKNQIPIKPTTTQKKPTDNSELSTEVFVMPSVTLKRSSASFPKLNNSPSKLRRTTEDVKVKRLSTPSLRKSSSMSGGCQRDTVEVPRTLPKLGSFSSRKRKVQKVAEWLPVRKLKLSSTTNEDGRLSSPAVDSSIDLAAPDPFLAATTLNPFSEGGLYLSEEWLQAQEQELIDWAGRMLRPPGELELDREHAHNTLYRLNALRATAFNLLIAPETAMPLSKVKVAVDKKIICIRSDKQLHVDLGLQDKVISLLMNYNPLWLRLCLEAIFQCTIDLKRHSDSAGLINFIRKRVISDDFIKESCSHPSIPYMMLPEFEDKMKKFTLYKFLVLVYLLDLVKRKKVIFHDPCLFKKDSKLKSSKEILIEFNKTFIAGAGDITKVLRMKGYEVSHCQTYLHEFDFTLNNRSELRDGVRLTKLAEILVGDNSLCSKLRLPAISSLQKKFNAEVAITALKNAGYDLPQNVSAKDITEGHKEKTLSFLWHLRGIIQKQAVILIISKWRETILLRQDRRNYLKIRNSVIKIQNWYRKMKNLKRSNVDIEQGKREREQFLKLKSVVLIVQRNFRIKKEKKERERKNSAAIIIQKWYRNKKDTQKAKDKLREFKNAVVKIQRAFRRYKNQQEGQNSEERIEFMRTIKAVHVIQRKLREKLCTERERMKFLKIKHAALVIQRRFRAYLLAKCERNSFLKLKSVVIIIQRRYREKKLARKERLAFLSIKEAAIFVQRKFRHNRLARQDRQSYLSMREAVVYIQRKIRANRLARKDRQSFISMREAAVYIQRKFKANRSARKDRQSFISLRESAVCIQRKFRANRLARQDRQSYLSMREAVVYIQRKIRANRLARKDRQSFISMREAAVYIQRKFRANRSARKGRQSFISVRESAVCIQRKFRANRLARQDRQLFISFREATMYVQRKFRANRLARKDRQSFVSMREAAVYIQRMFRANRLARKDRQSFVSMREAVMCVQRKFRAKTLARQDRRSFISMREGVVYIQRKFRANRLARKDRQYFISLKEAAVCVQRKFRANTLARQGRRSFLSLRDAAIYIQRKFRANRLARKGRESFVSIREAAVYIQRKFRTIRLARQDRQSFLSLRAAAVYIQRKVRANRLARKDRQSFISMRESTVCIQRKFRAYRLAIQDRRSFRSLRDAAIYIQRKFRANRLARQDRQLFTSIREATMYVQRKFRANRLARKCRRSFLCMREAAVFVQRRFRANTLARQDRQSFMTMREAAMCVQRKFRANRLAKQDRRSFLSLRDAAIYIQRKFRANRLARKGRESFVSIREAAVYIQRKFRTIRLARQDRQSFLSLRAATVYIQRKFRGNKLARQDRQSFVSMREAAVYIQRKFRANKLARQDRQSFVSMREAAVYIQRKFRANKLARENRLSFLFIKEAAVCVQRKFRANRVAKQSRQSFLRMKISALLIQQKYRATRLARENRMAFLTMKNIVIVIQRRFRANLSARYERQQFLALKNGAICIQRRFRSYLTAKKERQYFINLRWAAVVIQRKYKAMCETRNAQAVSVDLEVQKRANAALKIQAIWRGRMVRKNVVVPRPKIQTSDMERARVPLAIRGSHILQALQDFPKLSVAQMQRTLYNLDVVTSLTANQCHYFVSNGIVKIFYNYVGCMNKALGVDRCIELILLILINVYRAPQTAEQVWQDTLEANGITHLVELMLNFRLEKTSTVFCKACTALWLFAQDPAKVNVIMSSSKVVHTLKYIMKNFEKTKQNVPATSKKLVSTKKNAVPAMVPNWGNYYNHPRAFSDKTFAFESVTKLLKLI
ncbi:protein abnormal spindle isoform X2 [Homalodisca vitripennis]|uniref:protein abnormal spindle isoform X2 n=1 Tax=Homalodisca vitripennis TaxID=197043 RepID=UPI001EEC2A46|nr:protein abnormal spindle isoform X2 [Homalodisca vitripennis]